MSGVAIEDLLELWSAELRKAKAKLGWLIGHPSVVASAAAFLDTLLGPERRKTGWMRAEAAGDPGPWRQQAVLGRSHWDADALRDVVRDYALETLAEGDAVLVIDETGFLKQGKASCGVAPAVHRLGGQDHQLPDRRLRRLCLEPGATPSSTGSSTCPRPGPTTRSAWRRPMCPRMSASRPSRGLRSTMIERAIDAGVPFAWVAADSVYGVGGVEMALRRAGKGYVLGVASTTQFHSWDKPEPVSGTAEEIAAALPAVALGSAVRRRRDQGTPPLRLGLSGAGRSRCARLLRLSLRVDDVDTRPADPARPERRQMAFFSTWCPKGTPMAVLVEVEGRRWAIEDAFETAKTELGLDHNETRSWHGWHRHVSLVMLAFALLMAIRHKAETLTSPQKRPPTHQRNPWSDGPSRRSVVLPGV